MSTKAIAKVIEGELNERQIASLVGAGIIPKDTPNAQINVFAEICRRRNLDPFTKQIHLVQHGNRYTAIVGIGGKRSIASRTGLHAGTDDAVYNLQADGRYQTAAQVKAGNRLPVTATVTVYKVVAGARVSFTHTAVFSEFTTDKMKWKTMPFQMISKAAESHALVKAFPDELSGLFSEAQMGALEDSQAPEINTVIGPDVIEVEAVEVSDDDLEAWASQIKSLAKQSGKTPKQRLDDISELYRNNKEAVGTDGPVVDLFSKAKNALNKEHKKLQENG